MTMKRIDRWLVTAGLDPVSLKAKMREAALHGADAKLSGGKPLAGEEDQRVGLPPMREASPSQSEEKSAEVGGDLPQPRSRRFGLDGLKLITTSDARGRPPMHNASSPARRPRVSLVVVEGRAHATWP
jgi:hypothetical protein